MAELGYQFDGASVEDTSAVMPEHECLAQVVESEVAATKNGTGQILKLTWELVDGQFAKRKVWQNINIVNQNATAQDIGQRDLKRITEAMGLGPISNSEALHFKPIAVKVAIEAGKGGYDDRNIVKVKKQASGGVPSPAPAAGGAPQASSGAPAPNTAKPAAAAPAASARPWAR